jgi:hypothetical protein
MAIQNCDILTLSKTDLVRMEVEFEDMVSEMFLNAHKKIRKTLKIKEETENAYIMNKVSRGNTNILVNRGTPQIKLDKNGEKTWDVNGVRRMTTLYGKRSNLLEDLSPLPLEGGKDKDNESNLE